MTRLRMLNGPESGATFSLGKEPLFLGGSYDCGVRILDASVAPEHAEVFRVDEMCFIRDLGTRTGTYVNGRSVDRELLRDGDEVRVGDTLLVYEARSTPTPVRFTRAAEDRLTETESLPREGAPQRASELYGAGSRALLRLTRLLAQARAPEALYREAVQICAEELEVDEGYLFTPEPRRGMLVAAGSYRRAQVRDSKVSRTILRRALAEKRAILSRDAMQDERFGGGDSVRRKRIHTVIASPVLCCGEARGVLYLARHRTGRVFVNEDLCLAAAMSDLLGLAVERVHAQQERRAGLLGTLRLLTRLHERRDPQGAGRGLRVAGYAAGIALQMDLPRKTRGHIELAALLQDLAPAVMEADNAAGAPDAREAAVELAREIAAPARVVAALRLADERWDGQGPQGLRRDSIPVAARVLAVARAFEAHAHGRRGGTDAGRHQRGIAAASYESNRRYDPQVVKALVAAHRLGVLYTERPDLVPFLQSA